MSLTYSQLPLDRCTNQRKNKRWLKSEFNHPNTLFCVINDGMSFFEQSDELKAIYLSKAQLAWLKLDSCIYLGKGALIKEYPVKEGSAHLTKSLTRSVFAVDFNKLRFSIQEELAEMGQWLSLRKVTASLAGVDASILALAKGLVHWHSSHQYCGLCGSINCAVEAGHARKCTECRNLTFPRTDPAVIMLVERMFADGIARCLLGRQASWPQGMYSTLAGFVDPGESLEQAVIREVLEETAIAVELPQYIASQPWPFPASIMLGFTAVATSEAVDISQDDLEDAKWFSREQLADFVVNASVANALVANTLVVNGSAINSSVINTEAEQNKKTDSKTQSVNGSSPQYKMSSGDSISSYLITAWLNKEIGYY